MPHPSSHSKRSPDYIESLKHENYEGNSRLNVIVSEQIQRIK